MGQVDSHGPEGSETPPPPWWDSDGAEVPLESIAIGAATLPSEIEKAHEAIRFLARTALRLRQRLEEELEHRYKPHSEKRPQGQGQGNGAGQGTTTPGETSSSSPPGSTPPPSSAGNGDKPRASKPGHGRRPIPPHLPRQEVEVPLEDERCKQCKGHTHRLEKVESYRFDYVPGYIQVRVLIRWKHVCDDPTCEAPFRIAKLPPEPIPKGRATAEFLAHLLVNKFADHCPLYRFAKILQRQGVDLPRSTLVDYCKKSTDLLKPLWELMKKRALASDIIQTDDTHVQVRLPRKKGVLTGHLWAYKGDEAHPYVVFDFTPTWEGKAPQAFLATFEGYIQADGYKGYHELFKNPRRILVGCLAHARRKWWKARDSSPEIAHQALDMIDQLYAIEKAANELTPDERKRQRQEQAAPILEKLRIWIDEQAGRVLPKSPVAKAITYAKNQWTALTRYLEDGRLSIDNNPIERELRRVALGRKNWLAAGSEVGGETAAVGYTMIASALACGVNPVEWLADVLTRIVTCPPGELEDLLPDRWKAARTKQSAAPATPRQTDGAPLEGADASASSPLAETVDDTTATPTPAVSPEPPANEHEAPSAGAAPVLDLDGVPMGPEAPPGPPPLDGRAASVAPGTATAASASASELPAREPGTTPPSGARCGIVHPQPKPRPHRPRPVPQARPEPRRNPAAPAPHSVRSARGPP